MIEELSSIPIRMEKLEALLNGRLSPNDPILPEIAAEHRKWQAGYRGEKAVELYLKMLPETRYYIFHSLRLRLGEFFFQIDYLVLCAAFAIALEVKNRAGELNFKKNFNQTTCKKNGEEERIQNPVLQVRLQAIKFKAWLQEYHFTEIPVYYLFVNSNGKTLIAADPGNETITSHICNSEFLLEKIEQLASYNQAAKLDSKELRKIKRLLLIKHTPENLDILKQFNLSPKDILTGVKCPKCDSLPMDYQKGFWLCLRCNTKSKGAHIPAINEYFLLIKPTITNSELREWLRVGSIRMAGKLLVSLNLPFTGKFKDRVYHQLPVKNREHSKN